MTVALNTVPNRYKHQMFIAARNADGSYSLSISFRVPFINLSSINRVLKHRVKGNETLDKIALEYYGVPDLWYVIADANPIKLFYPNDILLLKGEYIDIPPVSIARLL